MFFDWAERKCAYICLLWGGGLRSESGEAAETEQATQVACIKADVTGVSFFVFHSIDFTYLTDNQSNKHCLVSY